MTPGEINLSLLFERTVFLFGAGASMDAGCLSSKAMLASLRDEIRVSAAAGGVKEFSSIYDFILQSLAYQIALKGNADTKLSELSNIEDFVAVLRQILDREYIVPPPLVGNWNNKITRWEILNENMFGDFLNFAYNMLVTKWTRFDKSKADALLQPIRELLQLAEDFAMRIFSLNYDLIFETVFNNENEHLVDVGFSKMRWSGDFENPHSPAKVKLYKLHGSVNWYFDKFDEEVKEEVPDGERPLLVFGSGPKVQSYDPFLSLLSTFRDKLKAANLFVVVGYSFQDKYINNILIQTLNSGDNKKMLVVDPFLDEDVMKFVERVEKYQNLKSMNEIVNLTKISPARVDIRKQTASEFFNAYLSDGAAKLKEELGTTEAGENVF